MHLRRLLVRLAVHGPVRWVMCGNYVDLQQIIYAVTRKTGSSYYETLKNNILISRAETCYQISSLLRKTNPAQTPTVVSDFLLRFQDEKVPEADAANSLGESIQSLNHLCQTGPVIVSTSASELRPQLLDTLVKNAGQITQLKEVPIVGHNTDSMTQRVRQEHNLFVGFCRALMAKSDRLLFDAMWGEVEAYIPAMEKASHPLLIATIIIAMVLGQRKMIVASRTQVEKLEHDFKADQKSRNDAIERINKNIQYLDSNVDERIQALREEFREMMYPTDASL
jgi:hypothetical protein